MDALREMGKLAVLAAKLPHATMPFNERNKPCNWIVALYA